MVNCATDSWSAPCQVQPSQLFTTDEQVCVAWVEVNREPQESVAIHIHSSAGQPVFTYSEDTYAVRLVTRVCCMIRIDRPLWGDLYTTDFVIAGELTTVRLGGDWTTPTPTARLPQTR